MREGASRSAVGEGASSILMRPHDTGSIPRRGGDILNPGPAPRGERRRRSGDATDGDLGGEPHVIWLASPEEPMLLDGLAASGERRGAFVGAGGAEPFPDRRALDRADEVTAHLQR